MRPPYGDEQVVDAGLASLRQPHQGFYPRLRIVTTHSRRDVFDERHGEVAARC